MDLLGAEMILLCLHGSPMSKKHLAKGVAGKKKHQAAAAVWG